MTSTEPPTCEKCGALVADEGRHATWHRELERRLADLEKGGSGPFG